MNRYGKKVDLLEDAKQFIVPFDRTLEQGCKMGEIGVSSLEKLDVSEIFEHDFPLEVEVGFGTSKFLVEYTGRNPSLNFIGIENSKKMVFNGANKIYNNSRLNARVIHADAVFYLEAKIENESLNRIHIYFPDPWFKKRHTKRRIINEKFLKVCYAALKPKGKLNFFTDHKGYFEYFSECVSLGNLFKFSTEVADYTPTSYEEKWLLAGRTINRAILEKNPSFCP